MKVKNMTSPRGNIVKNQFIINDHGKTYFQSYDSIIAVKNCSQSIELDKHYWDYSRTTGKYRNIFLNESKKKTQEKIDSGIYILADLNK